MNHRVLKAVFALLGGLLLVSSGLAQTTSASLTGTVQDPSGAAVPGAAVRAIDARTKWIPQCIETATKSAISRAASISANNALRSSGSGNVWMRGGVPG